MTAELVESTDAVEDQDGVLTGSQARSLFGRHHTENQIAAKRWQRPARGVVVLHNGPLTTAQRHWVALLAAAPGSVLGGLTALGYDGFDGFVQTKPSVVQPMGARRPAAEDVDVHWSIWLGGEDVHPLRHPPRTRPARSLVDAASWQRHERRARAIVLAGAQQGLVTTRQLRAALTRRGSCRHRALIVESILDAYGGVQSLPEHDFETIRRGIGAPLPSRPSVRRRVDGKCYLDVEWREYGAGCEIHGIPHIRVLNWESDLERANEIAIGGPRLLVFSSYAVRREQARVADQLLRLLRRGGWRG